MSPFARFVLGTTIGFLILAMLSLAAIVTDLSKKVQQLQERLEFDKSK